MDIVTIACARDKIDMMLHAHSIAKFVTVPTKHYVVIEDDEMGIDEWKEALEPHYANSNVALCLIKAGPREIVSFGLPSPVGHRRVGYLKLETVATTTTDKVLVLDGKNIFIRYTDLSEWKDINHGSGRNMLISQVDASNIRNFGAVPLQWMKYVCEQFDLELPNRMPIPLETPYVMQRSVAKEIVSHPKFNHELFLQDMIWPFTELHMYYCFIDDDLGKTTYAISPAMAKFSKREDESWLYAIERAISNCDMGYKSPTHGLHRVPRRDMGPVAADIYSRWLINKGLNKSLVHDYVYFEMPDQSW